MKIAQERAEPIPVYAEMSSINPVILLPDALETRAEAIAEAFVRSLLNGAGQFCTSPGLLIAIEGNGLDRFLAAASLLVAEAQAAVMLTPAILGAYTRSVETLLSQPGIEILARGGKASMHGQAGLFAATAEAFLANPVLHHEMFGSSALVVKCRHMAEVASIMNRIEGQLTCSVHLAESDYSDATALLPTLERKAGRVIFKGFGTGVEVCHAVVHGGPFPATSDGRTTSVGSLAIERFCGQSVIKTSR